MLERKEFSFESFIRTKCVEINKLRSRESCSALPAPRSFGPRILTENLRTQSERMDHSESISRTKSQIN